MSRTGPLLAREHAARDVGVVLGIAAAQLIDRRARQPEVGRVEVVLGAPTPRETSQMWLWPVVVSSSRPSSPRNTSAVAPRVWNTPTNSGTLSSWATPTADASGRAGLHSGPRKLKTVGIAELGAGRPGVPESGVEQRREREGDADLIEHRRDPLGRERQVDAERREHVRRPGCRATRPCCRA